MFSSDDGGDTEIRPCDVRIITAHSDLGKSLGRAIGDESSSLSNRGGVCAERNPGKRNQETETEMKGRILVADDDLFCRKSLRHFLENEGIEVDEAQSGKEIVTLLAGHYYDMGIYDYHLPDAGIASVLSEIEIELPFVIMTGDSSSQTEKLARRLSPAFFFVKPIQLADLLNVVVRVLRTGECEWRKNCW